MRRDWNAITSAAEYGAAMDDLEFWNEPDPWQWRDDEREARDQRRDAARDERHARAAVAPLTSGVHLVERRAA